MDTKIKSILISLILIILLLAATLLYLILKDVVPARDGTLEPNQPKEPEDCRMFGSQPENSVDMVRNTENKGNANITGYSFFSNANGKSYWFWPKFYSIDRVQLNERYRIYTIKSKCLTMELTIISNKEFMVSYSNFKLSYDQLVNDVNSEIQCMYMTEYGKATFYVPVRMGPFQNSLFIELYDIRDPIGPWLEA